jgi:hypothetical protein
MAALETLYQEIKDLGVVTSQREFSGLWGKKESWCSTSMTRRRQPGLDALVRFHVTLNDLERETLDAAMTAENKETAQSYADGAMHIAVINASIWSEIVLMARGDSVASLQ